MRRRNMSVFQPNTRILFQGDSITEGARGRTEDPNHILGHGFVFLIAAKYGAKWPERNLTFLNRGIPGNKVSDLKDRWTEDTIKLKPDVVSLLIGANDANAKVPVAEYEGILDELLARTVTELPGVRLILGEPFTLPGAKHAGDWEAWRADFTARQEVVARLAEKYSADLVRFQKAFEEAAERAPADYWIWDTIHPTYSGHQVMAEAWEKTLGLK